MPKHPDLAAVLRRERAKSGLSQYELAEKSGVSRQTIANLETGIHETARLSTLASLAAGLGIPLEVLASSDTSAAAPYVEQFLASDWARVAKPTDDEVAWLRSLPSLTWLGSEPTNETFFHMLEALRARAAKQ